MPARNPRTGINSGFGGFAPNPYFRTADGRHVRTSDVEQARNAMDFGIGTTTAPRPTPSPSPAFNAPPPRSIPPAYIDTSGPGIGNTAVNSRIFQGGDFSSASPSRQSQTWMNPNEEELWAYGGVNSPASGRAEAIPVIPSRGGQPPPFISDPNDDWMGRSGEPNVEVAREDATSRGSGMADEPVLFPDRSTEPLPTASTNEWTTSPGDRRFLPSPSTDPRYMSGFGGNMTIGQFLNTPLAFLRFGEGRGGTPPVGAGRVLVGAETANRSSGGRPPPIITDPNADWTGDADAAFAAAEEQGARDIADAKARGELNPDGTTPGEPGGEPRTANPASRFGNLNSPTGQPVYFDGRNWRPVSGAPADVRWDPNNPNNSNATASQTTDQFVLGGGYYGNTNSPGYAISEGGYGQFDPRQGTARLDESGGISFIPRPANAQKPMDMSWMKNAPALYGSTAEKRNDWMRKQPDYIAWMKARGG